MSKHGILLSPVMFFLLLSCDNSSKAKKNIPNDSAAPEVNSKQKDSIPLKLTDSLKPDDRVKEYAANQNAEVKRYISWLRKEWQNAPNPITATYQGNDFGDYHHILFKAANGITYDFGQAKNNYGQYKLHELSGQYADSPEFLGKKFKVYWDWKLDDFLCCDGEYGKAKAYLPSIIKLELIK